jgi:tRNA A-37 threonylcarbamoyl transferase component Bud32
MTRIGDYRRIEGAAATWWFAPDRAAALAPLLADAADRIERLPGAAILRENRARRLVALPLDGGGRGFAKLFLRKEGLQGLLDRFRSRAVREASALIAAAGAGVAAPRPVAFAVGYGPDVAGILVTDALPEAEPLQQVLERAGRLLRGAAFRARRDLLRRLGGMAARLEEAGWRHGDLHTGNILISPPMLEGTPYVIDWQRARRGGGHPPDLVDLVYSLSRSVPRTEQMATLRTGLPSTATKGFRREACGWVKWRKERHLESRTVRCLRVGTEFAVA